MAAKIYKKIDGILLLDKPLHLTSNSALQKVKRLFNAKKAGHTGSLDPLATGMLPLCFGEATKVSQYLLDSDKYYEVTAKLGEQTLTGDAEGEVIATGSVAHITLELLQETAKKFLGVIEQIPPMFSALKHQGKPLYELARQGIEVERKARQVTIHQFKLKEYVAQKQEVSFSVHCTKGTYIRTLIEDLGEALGCKAYVAALRRSAVAPYEEAAMVTLEQLEKTALHDGVDALQKYLLPLESSITQLPIVKLSASTAFYIRTGNTVMAPHTVVSGLVRLFSENDEFLGIGEVLEDGRVAPKRLLAF